MTSTPDAPAAPPPAMTVRFWGVRGSIPSPGPDTNRYGGNTSCVSVEAPGHDLVILDAGSGIRKLALSLLRDKRLPVTAHLLLTHTHWDHIQGFPFFVPALIPGNRIHVYGAAGAEVDVERALEGQMHHHYFPIGLHQMAAELRFTNLEIGRHEIAGYTVTTAALYHSSYTTGYRVTLGGRTVTYLTDAEPRRRDGEVYLDPAMVDLARGSDVLIHDAQYTDAEYPGKITWGHSPLGYVLDVAQAAEVKNLVLFHHDPMRTDAQIDALVEECRQRALLAKMCFVVDAAREGMEFALPLRPARLPRGKGAPDADSAAAG